MSSRETDNNGDEVRSDPAVMNVKLPGAAGEIARDQPDIWAAYAALGEATAAAGGLSERERRLVKLALSFGAGSEGAVHSHARRALSEEIPVADLEQVALLAIGPLGFPSAIAGYTWIKDETQKSKPYRRTPQRQP